MKSQLYLQTATTHLDNLPLRQDFLGWLKATLLIVQSPLLENATSLELTVRLVDEAESAKLNKQYRHKSGPTNILSFPAKNLLDAKCYYLGDLLICVPLVFEQAIAQHKTSIAHWAHLTVHGIVHLLGYDHEQEHEAIIMEALETAVLKNLGYENPYE